MNQSKWIVNVRSEGLIITKTYGEAYVSIEKLASNHHQMIYDKDGGNIQ